MFFNGLSLYKRFTNHYAASCCFPGKHSGLDLFSKKCKNVVIREYSSNFGRSKKILNTVSGFAAERKFMIILPHLKIKI